MSPIRRPHTDRSSDVAEMRATSETVRTCICSRHPASGAERSKLTNAPPSDQATNSALPSSTGSADAAALRNTEAADVPAPAGVVRPIQESCTAYVATSAVGAARISGPGRIVPAARSQTQSRSGSSSGAAYARYPSNPVAGGGGGAFEGVKNSIVTNAAAARTTTSTVAIHPRHRRADPFGSEPDASNGAFFDVASPRAYSGAPHRGHVEDDVVPVQSQRRHTVAAIG